MYFFNDAATTEIYSLSLHDALPISHVDVIRPFERHDIPAVVKLFRWAFQRNGTHTDGELESYFDQLFFENPWREDDLPSWVHADDQGTIDGYIGVQPKRLRFRGRR